MAAQEVLTGIQIHRNGRYPYDYEQVQNSYSDLLKNIESDGEHGTKKGTFYAGMYTAVVDDKNSSYNGPYYISYQKTGSADNLKITYQATRIPLANEIAEIEKDWQTSYNNLQRYVENNFVKHNQLKSTGECIDASYVTTLGKEANLNIILPSLLTPAKYTKPSFEFKLSDRKNGPIYGKTGATITDPGNVIEVGSTINLCVNLKISSYNSNHNTLGLSYGLKNYSFQYGGGNYTYNLPGSYLITIGSQNATYTFSDEGLNLMIDNIYLSYQKSSYAYYPQLESKRVYVLSKENWFNETRFKIEDYKIVSKYKYYYGWDADVSASSFNPTQGTAVWLPIIKSGETTTTPNISFDKPHTSFWYAIPVDVLHKVNTPNNKNGFKVLYHTSIGDADLVSASTTVTEAYKSVIVGNKEHRYVITKIDFNKTISGATGNYVKFSMAK